jgi:Domain of unknown function (DUF4386)
MKTEMTSLKNIARMTGIIYFILALIATYDFFYVQPNIMVAGDTAATAKNMLANEFLFRTGMAAAVIANTLFVFVVLLLYRLLNQVNNQQARLMAGLVMVGIPVAFFADALKVTALSIFKGELLTSIPLQQKQDIAMTLIKIGSYSSQMITLYWGLWLLPLGLLIYKSGFIPRILGVLLIINGIGYVISSFTFILFPDQLAIVSKFVFPTYFIGEIPLIFWLMIIGVRDHLSIRIISETDSKLKPEIGKLKEQI